MPGPAAQLLLRCYGDSQDQANTASEIISEHGFHLSKADDSVVEMGDHTAYHYEYFEATENNIELLEQCVDELNEEFPNMDVWLRKKANKDRGSSIRKNYFLHIAPDREAI